MNSFFLELAATGLSMPIGADLLLHEHEDPEQILLDGKRLGKVIEETACRYKTPLAIPRMDLELEKQMLLEMMGIASENTAHFHFTAPLDSEMKASFEQGIKGPLPAKVQASIEAIRYITEQTSLYPVGMSIGPFSLMTKLVKDPITPVCMAGAGLTAEVDESICLIEELLTLGSQVIHHNISKQIDAGAKAIFIAEPAANIVYFSPNQIESGSDIFERYVMAYNKPLKDLLDQHEVALIFHCCGELTDYMVECFGRLEPAVLSLGSSRKLWKDAILVSKQTVLFGNLPSKLFYSDEIVPLDKVTELGQLLTQKMREVNHPFILGSECDILSVPNSHATIQQKAEAIAQCRCKTHLTT